jgi:hypothetical protein
MPRGIDAPVFVSVAADGYVWGHQNGIFGQWPFSLLKGADGAAGTNGINGAAGASGYTITNNTSASTDLLLNAGDVAYINYTTSSLTWPLYVQTVEGLYEVTVISSSVVSEAFITPNYGTANVPAANSVVVLGGYVDTTFAAADATAHTYTGFSYKNNKFKIASATQGLIASTISTVTATKAIHTTSVGMLAVATDMRKFDLQGIWNDTTTAWTSLGAITFSAASSGKIVIRRII